MNVREIYLKNFGTQPAAEIRLPATGVVLVTGENGTGKSSAFVESVAVACFGKTLRGTPPWEEGKDTQVRVVTDLYDVKRGKDGKKPITHEWTPVVGAPVLYDTKTKGKEPFEALAGNFEVWRRTSIFSSRGASHFSLAPDSTRKKLLETIIGLERFDSGLKACREDLSSCNKALATLTGQAAVLREKVKGYEARLQDLQDTEDSEQKVLDPRVPKARQEAALREIQDCRYAIQELAKRRAANMRQLADIEAEFNQAKKAQDRLDRDNCPTCDQGIPHEHRVSLRTAATDLGATLKKARAKASKEEAEITAATKDTNEELDRLRKYVERANTIEREWANVESNTEKRNDKRGLLESELKAVKAKLVEAETKVDIMRQDQGELEAAELTLGLKGPRVKLLRDAMAGLTALANGWLARLFPGVTIKLHEEKDKVALSVLGLRHGHGYAACSDGQQRRIDIALLLALSDMEASSRGVRKGTIVMDEVADALDEKGLAFFSEVINEIAQERCVVLISHNPVIYQGHSIHTAKRFRVAESGISEH